MFTRKFAFLCGKVVSVHSVVPSVNSIPDLSFNAKHLICCVFLCISYCCK